MLKLETISSIIKWFEENHEWFFSGLGVQILVATLTLITFIVSGLFLFLKGKLKTLALKQQVARKLVQGINHLILKQATRRVYDT